MGFQVLHLFPTDPIIWIFVVIQKPVRECQFKLSFPINQGIAWDRWQFFPKIGDIQEYSSSRPWFFSGVRCEISEKEIGVPKTAALPGLKPTSSKKGKTYWYVSAVLLTASPSTSSLSTSLLLVWQCHFLSASIVCFLPLGFFHLRPSIRHVQTATAKSVSKYESVICTDPHSTPQCVSADVFKPSWSGQTIYCEDWRCVGKRHGSN